MVCVQLTFSYVGAVAQDKADDALFLREIASMSRLQTTTAGFVKVEKATTHYS